MNKKFLLLLVVIACLCLPTKSAGQVLTDFYNYNKGAVILNANFKAELNKASGGVYTSGDYTWKTGDPLPNPAPNGMYNGVPVTSMSSMFYDCPNLRSLDLSNFDTSNVTNMSYMFYKCNALTSLNLSNLDTSKVTSMSYMFCQCNRLTSLDLSNFDTSKVTSMSYMFSLCNLLTRLDLSNFDTSNVTNMFNMFLNCDQLTSLDLSNFDTSKVTDMSYMFCQCNRLTSLDLSNFDTSKVTSMSYMFFQCNLLTRLDLSNFDTSKVIYMNSMFSGCSRLTSLDLSNFDMSKGPNLYAMFDKCGRAEGSGQAAIGIAKNWETAYLLNNSGTSTSGSFIDKSTLKFGVADKYNNMDYVLFQDSDGSNKSATIVASSATPYSGAMTIASNVEVGADVYPVTAVATMTFKDCVNLSSVELPMGIAKVGDYSFVGTPASISMNMLAGTPPAVTGRAFDDAHYASATLTVPGAAKTAYNAHDVWGKFIQMPSGIDNANKDNSGINVARISNGVIVSGVEAGETVKLFSGDGALTRSVKASGSSVTIDGVQSGMYIVTVGAEAVKVVI